LINELKGIKKARAAVAALSIVLATASLVVLLQVNQSAEAGILTPAESTTGETIFSDDFSGDLSQWPVQSGTWAIEAGELVSYGDKDIILASVEIGDAVMETKVKLINKKEDAHLIMRAQDTDNFYILGLGPWNYKWGIAKRVAGSWIPIAVSGVYTDLELGTTYTLRGEVQGNQLRLYVDDYLEVEGVDNTFSYGKVGLIALHSGQAHFDYAKVNVSITSPAYGLKVRSGVTQIVVTCNWGGSGNITIANLTRSPTVVYYESNMTVYEKTTVSTSGATSIFNIRRAVLPIGATTVDETWMLYLNVNDVTSYQVSAETS